MNARFTWSPNIAGLAASALVAAAMAPAAEIAGPVFTLRTGPGGGPMLLDGTRGYGGFNPGANLHDGNLGFNSQTMVLYAMDLESSGNECHRLDPMAEYEKGTTAVNAAIGTTRTYTTGYHYRGAVSGGSDIGNSAQYFCGNYDPYMLTEGHTGVMVLGASGGAPPVWTEYIAQTADEALGELNEGSIASPVDTSARVTIVKVVDSIGALGGSGHWWDLEMDRFKGQFVATDGAIGPRLVSRYFMGIPRTSTPFGPFVRVVVCHANAARDTEPTTTTNGWRSAYLRNRSTSGADCTLLGTNDFANLVPGYGDGGYDMAQDPQTGDLFFLSSIAGAEGTNAFLSAIRPSIPDDSTQPMSYQVVDLDPDTEATHLTLGTFHPDLRFGSGLTFNHDGSRLYVTVRNNTAGGVRAVYALDRGSPAAVVRGAAIIVR